MMEGQRLPHLKSCCYCHWRVCEAWGGESRGEREGGKSGRERERGKSGGERGRQGGRKGIERGDN